MHVHVYTYTIYIPVMHMYNVTSINPYPSNQFLFILFLLRERVNKNIWYDFKPKSAYLTEGDIDMFVGCILPAARMATFSKLMSLDPALSLRNLAFLRPEMVLPDLLDRCSNWPNYNFVYVCIHINPSSGVLCCFALLLV